MAIHRKPKKSNKSQANDFIDGSSSISKKDTKVAISLRFDPVLLTKINEISNQRGMSRNALISYWCSKGVEQD